VSFIGTTMVTLAEEESGFTPPGPADFDLPAIGGSDATFEMFGQTFVLGASIIPFLFNVTKSWKYGQLALRDDPWGHGNSLEWATSSPPPRHNFVEIPRIRSERPAFELHYPHMLERLHAEAHSGKRHEPYASELLTGKLKKVEPRFSIESKADTQNRSVH